MSAEPTRRLPPHPSLEQQRTLAKELLKAHRDDDAEATARIRAHLPDKPRISLADAQLVLAREYGFESWSALKSHVERVSGDAADTMHAELHEAFHAASAGGDVSAIRALFGRDPAARAMIDAPLFAFDSPALVHFAAADDLPMVDLLLEHGADPNARSLWWAGGFHPLHTARGGVAERLLEAGAVPDACAAAHLDRLDLLAELLEADPTRVHERGGDGQTPLHLARSREVVDFLLDHGADLDARDVDHRATPAQWMLDRHRDRGRYPLARYLVERGASVDVFLAAALGLTAELRRMLEADPSVLERRTGRGEYGEQPPSSFHIYTWTIGQHLSPIQVAAQFGQGGALDVLGSFASPKDRFLAACAGGAADEARGILAERPRLMDELGAEDRRAVADAAWAADADAVELMLSLGFPVDATGQDGGTVLHLAAWQGALRCVQVALAHDPERSLLEQRDPVHGSTALGWCCHGSRHCRNPRGDYPAVARLLLEAGARPGPNLKDAAPEVLAVLRERGEGDG